MRFIRFFPVIPSLVAVAAVAALDVSPIGVAELDSSSGGGIPKLRGIVDASNLITSLKDDNDSSKSYIDVQLVPDDNVIRFEAILVEGDSAWHGEQTTPAPGENGNNATSATTFGSANFYLSDDGRRLTGSITDGKRVCSIATHPGGTIDGVHFTCIGLGDFPPDLEPVLSSSAAPDNDGGEAGQGPLPELLQGDELDYVDVMVVYTHRAMCGEAGLEYPCDITDDNKRPIEDRAALAVQETNTAYEMSGVSVGKGMRLVHVYLDEDYDDAPQPYDAQTALDELTNPSDGMLDDAHELRVKYGADLVALWSEDLNACGLAWVFDGTPRTGFSVMQRDCTTGYYTFGHELCHNQGGQHNRLDSGYVADFGHAWRDFDDSFRTIVAYECDQVDCPKVQRFSTPRVTYQGLPLGDEVNDNVRQIEATWNAVASYMPMTRTIATDDAPSSSASSLGISTVVVFMPLLLVAVYPGIVSL